MRIPFDNSYAALPEGFFSRLNPTPVKEPKVLAWNAELAAELGIKGDDAQVQAQVFGGNEVPEGATMIGLKARSTLVPAEEWVKEFIPYGTPCDDPCEPSRDCIEKLETEMKSLRAEIDALRAEVEPARRSGTED